MAGQGTAGPTQLLDRLLRPGSDSRRDRWIDLAWLTGLGLLLIGAGLGLRDPWPYWLMFCAWMPCCWPPLDFL